MSVKQNVGNRILAGLLAACFLVACASPTDTRQGRHHAQAQVDRAAPGPTGISASQGGMAGGAATRSAPCCGTMGAQGEKQHKNHEAMCAMYRGMRDAPDEQARQAMMERHMPAMSPEMRQHHMDMMRQHCR